MSISIQKACQDFNWDCMESIDQFRKNLNFNYLWKIPKYLETKNIFLNNPQINVEIKIKIRKYFEMNVNKNATNQSLWHVTKIVFRGKYTALKAYIRKGKISQINDINFHFKKLEK